LKTAEIRELPSEELQTRLDEVKEELFNLRFQHATGQLENYSRLGQLRRDVARLRSIQRERELGIGREPEPEEVERSRRRREREKEGDDADAPRRRRGLRRGRGEEAEAGEGAEAEPTEASEEAGEVEEEE
jgi:large subunit ribosomal protein L29